MAENTLIAQITAVEKNIDRMLGLLKNNELRNNNISGKFLRIISPPKKRLTILKKNVIAPRVLTNAEIEWSWVEFLKIKKIVQRVLDQYLDYVGGIAVRRWQLDEHICDLAEYLVNEHLKQGSGWVSVAIVGEDRMLDDVAQTTQIIRLRFPEWDIWSLPFIAYEFGRWILGEPYIERLSEFFQEELDRVERLIKNNPQELIDRGYVTAADVKDGVVQGLAPDINALRQSSLTGDPISENLIQKLEEHGTYLKEFFADAFGIYFLGPAYAYAQVCLRIDPTTSLKDKPDEPSLARRLDLMLGLLKKMGESDPYDSAIYNPSINLLTRFWEETIQMTTPGYETDFDYGKPYDSLSETLLGKLEETYGDVGFSHKDWKAVEVLGDQFREQKDPDPNTTLPVVINAAWYCRMRYPDLISSVEKQARKLMLEVSSRRPEGTQQGSTAKPGQAASGG